MSTREDLGCCVDDSCNPGICMRLPEGKTCGDCYFSKKCVALFGVKVENKSCDFFPREFSEPSAEVQT